MFLACGNVCVAQGSMSASPEQLIRELRETAACSGPSLVIACAHGIRAGMAQVQQEMARSKECGYWPCTAIPRKRALRWTALLRAQPDGTFSTEKTAMPR